MVWRSLHDATAPAAAAGPASAPAHASSATMTTIEMSALRTRDHLPPADSLYCRRTCRILEDIRPPMLTTPRLIQDPARRNGYALAVALVLLVSTALRLWQLGTPPTLMFDEVYYAKDAKAIVDNRTGHARPVPLGGRRRGLLAAPGDGQDGHRRRHPAVRQPLLRLAHARARRRHRPPGVRVPARPPARPFPALGAAGPPLRRGRPVRDHPVAHRDPRHLHRRLDGGVHPVRPPLRTGRLAAALAVRLRRWPAAWPPPRSGPAAWPSSPRC